jgi:hypothetical protein
VANPERACGCTPTQKPSDCLAARRILTGDATQFEDDSEPFSVEGTTILTNQADAVLVYTAPVADAALFSPAFGDVVAAELAAFLAGPILRGAEGVKAMSDLRKLAMQLAADAAAQGRRATSAARAAEQQYVPSQREGPRMTTRRPRAAPSPAARSRPRCSGASTT